MYPPRATVHTAGRDTPDQFGSQTFDLANLMIGQTLEVVTHNSRWWFTRTHEFMLNGQFVSGIAVTSNSTNKGRNQKPPAGTLVQRLVTTGEPVHMKYTGSRRTGDVCSIRVLP